MDDGQRGTSTGVMDDLPDDTLDVAVPLAVVDRAESRGALAVLGVRLEDATGALTLCADHTSHF